MFTPSSGPPGLIVKLTLVPEMDPGSEMITMQSASEVVLDTGSDLTCGYGPVKTEKCER